MTRMCVQCGAVWPDVSDTCPKCGGRGVKQRAADEIERLQAQVASLTRERAWQPIETAPKDGTRVLTFGPDGIRTGYYDPGVKGHLDRFPEGWREVHQPTHWMPLPAPPAQAPQGAAQ